MSKKLKVALVTGSALLLFVLGMTVAHFQTFPYSQIMDLRTSPILNPFKEIVRQSAGSPDAVKAQIKNSALQRLLVKEVPLEKYPVHSSTYIAETSGFLQVVSTHGELSTFDLTTYERRETDIPSVPMNLEALMASPLTGGEPFSDSHFRVLGVYSEAVSNNADHLYVTHHRYDPAGDCVSFVLSRIEVVDGAATVGWETLFTGTPCMQTMIGSAEGSQRFHIRLTTGGAMTAYGDNELLFTVGDYGFDGMIHESLSDMPDSMFGKVYRLNKSTGETEMFAEGLRNSQGIFTDAEGTIWATDHGPGGGDELNIIREGAHYGWPEVTFGTEYNYQPWPHNAEQGRHSGYETPQYVWMNAIAPTDIVRIESTETFTDWNGDLLIGSLLDQSLHRVRVNDDYEVIYSERIELGHRIRNMKMLSNGSIALMTDGRVLIIIKDGGPVYEPVNENIRERLDDLNRYDGFLMAR